jgi:hypothetical protein
VVHILLDIRLTIQLYVHDDSQECNITRRIPVICDVEFHRLLRHKNDNSLILITVLYDKDPFYVVGPRHI